MEGEVEWRERWSGGAGGVEGEVEWRGRWSGRGGGVEGEVEWRERWSGGAGGEVEINLLCGTNRTQTVS